MGQYFSIANNQIPIELKPLYQEISKLFEKSLVGTSTDKEGDHMNRPLLAK